MTFRSEFKGGEIMSPLEMLKAGVIFGVTLYKIIKTNK